MTFYDQKSPSSSRSDILAIVIAALVFGVISLAYATSGNPIFDTDKPQEAVILGQDWHGNARRSDR